ncbi:putative transduction histidine kinase [Magnetospirillum sp. LM-5]|uniref:sensor histidine kinase n=1 Tax=Magnetospirillum sp. LM-5 TaxID=2681466 RepID=UPI001385C7E3|nr:ATP-binding protein [Magnetospirillum sp. LM-5]CAA7622866.1 putative transduction histidine kinase [Magnetospirillum sp. LM-5]
MRVPGFKVGVGMVGLWAAIAGLSAWHNLDMLDDQDRQAALTRARMVVTVIQTTRLWTAKHGGVYVPATEATPPNQWLVDPLRDVEINGRPFTKINPSYLTRQVAEMINADERLNLRLTSRRPIRPGNAPDAWEDQALVEFEAGLAEKLELVAGASGPVYRYISRMLVEEPCLKCHAPQGYQVGDVRGGLSVSIPLAEFTVVSDPIRRQILLVHGLGFVLLAGASLIFLARLRESWLRLDAARALQERMVAERTTELSAANDELARSNAELEHFAYIASHDLQEPLRMIGAYAQLVEKRYGPALDQDGREFLAYLSDGAGRMKNMIDDLLAYSRVGRAEASLADVSLEDLLANALINLDAAIAESGATVVRTTPLPQVRGAAPLLVRLLQNLIGNALKYRRPDLPPRVMVTAERAGPEWVVSVTDNGIGVPAEARERIFQIFQRLHTKAAYPGTGIGLAIAKKIVERHGGRIWVEEGPAGGSVFRFTVPAASPDVASTQQGRP